MEEIKLGLLSKTILIALVLVIVVALIYKRSNSFADIYESDLNEDYTGLVLKKEVQKHNHGARVIYLGYKPILIDSNFYELIDIGDSISKKKGESVIHLFKTNGKIHQFDFNFFYSNSKYRDKFLKYQEELKQP